MNNRTQSILVVKLNRKVLSMKNILALLTFSLFLLPLTLMANDQLRTDLIGTWEMHSINSEETDKGIAVFTQDTIITLINGKEDTRTNYTLIGDTITFDGVSGSINLNKNTLVLTSENDTIRLSRFSMKNLPRKSRKLLKRMQGDWFMVATHERGEYKPVPEEIEVKVTFGPATMEFFLDTSRQECVSFAIEEDFFFIESTKIRISFVKDTLKLQSEEEAMILIPWEQRPPVDTQFVMHQQSCKNTLQTMKEIIDQAYIYEATHGKFAPTLDSLRSFSELPLSGKEWIYSYTVDDFKVIVRATIAEGYSLGNMQSGVFLECDSEGNKFYSHRALKSRYLGDYLHDGVLVR